MHPSVRRRRALVERWGAETLVAAGVLDVFAVVDDTDVAVDPDESDHQLDAEDLWLEDRARTGCPRPTCRRRWWSCTAVRDLELVRDDAWPRCLGTAGFSDISPGRVVEPAWVLMPDGHRVGVPSYTAWWLARYAGSTGRPLGSLRLAGAVDLDGLLDPVGLALDETFLRAVGVRASLDEVLADPSGSRGPARSLGRRDAGRSTARGPRHGLRRHRPQRWPGRTCLRGCAARVKGQTVVVDAGEAVVVVDAPDLLPLLGSRPVLPVEPGLALDLADALDVALASELADFEVVGHPVDDADMGRGARRRTSAAASRRSPSRRRRECWRTSDSSVLGVDGDPVDVAWRSIGDDDHVRAGDPAALGRALAWRTNQWHARAAMAEALRAGTDEGAGALLDAEDVL